jgi:hypothetical protein
MAAAIPYLLIGLYLIFAGITAKSSFIDESDIPATREERREARPSPLKRILLVGTGVSSITYGIYALVSHH